jgi:hypothetical protein
MFCEHGLHVGIARESPFTCGLQPAIDALKLIRSCVICAAAQARLDLERDLRDLPLRLFRSGLNSLQYLFERFHCHGRLPH